MKEETAIKSLLPKEAKKGVNKNIKTLVLFGMPKVGKTTSLAKLKNCLIIDTEKGTDFIEGAFVVNVPDEGPLAKWRFLKDLAEEIKSQNYPYDYVVIDTFSELDEISEWVGTANYMMSPQGKRFNRESDEVTIIKKGDPRFESVHSIGQGYGYKYSREAILDMFDTLKNLGKICTIFVCHVTDKTIAVNGSSVVNGKDLALTGKVKDIIPRKVDAVACMYQENNELKISFVGSEHKVGGVRVKHLTGYEGPLDWEKIFI